MSAFSGKRFILKISMNKKKFKIVHYDIGEDSFYDTMVKTWFGWISFAVFYKEYVVHVLSDPTDQKALAYKRIYHYCDTMGYDRKGISITEITSKKPKKWIFLRRIYSGGLK